MCETRRVDFLTDEWRVYAETDIPQKWVQKEDGTPVRIDQYWNQALQLKTPLGSQKFSVLAKTVKCALGLSHGNTDNERSLSVNKKTLSKETSGLSKVTLNGLLATDDGLGNVNGLSNIVVTKEMLSTVKGSYKADMQHIDKEKAKDKKKKSNSSEAEAEEIRKKNRKLRLKILKAMPKSLMQECQELIRCFSQLVDLWRKEIRECQRDLLKESV